jgi:glycosyltransferase involved in cell wall biosynthesis
MTEILFVLPSFSGGGAERVVINLINCLHAKGVNVQLIVFNSHGPLRNRVLAEVPIDVLGIGTLRGSIFSLVKKIRELRPNVIFSTFGYVNVVLVTIRVFFPKQCRVWIREANLPSISLKNNRREWLMWLAYRVIYRYADRLLVTSQRMRKEFIAEFRLSPRMIHVSTNPIDENEILQASVKPDDVASSALRYIACGRLTYQKGFDRLLEWFAELDIPNATLTIVGDGEKFEELKRLSSSLAIADRVTFTGFMSEPWEKFMSADVLLLPSRWEGMPNVALEALVCGVPVIATPESGGIAELADISELGAVKVVQAGRPFLDAMRNVIPRDRTKSFESMLPPQYRCEFVVERLLSWLNEID